jgi:hypothetical protein
MSAARECDFDSTLMRRTSQDGAHTTARDAGRAATRDATRAEGAVDATRAVDARTRDARDDGRRDGGREGEHHDA